MNKLLLTAFLATSFLVFSDTNLQAQMRPNNNLYRQSLIRPAPQPLPVLRNPNVVTNSGYFLNAGVTYPNNTYVNPYNTYVNPYNTYVNPTYYNSGYYPGVYPSYYQNTFPSYYPSTYPSYYSPNSYYGVFPGY